MLESLKKKKKTETKEVTLRKKLVAAGQLISVELKGHIVVEPNPDLQCLIDIVSYLSEIIESMSNEIAELKKKS